MRGTNRTRTGVAVALLCLAAVSACSDDDPNTVETTPPPTTSAAPSPSEMPTPTPPALKGDPKGAEAFVKYFWEVFNYTFATRDESLLRSISDRSCTFCMSTQDQVRAWRGDGSRVEGSEITTAGVSVPPLESNGRVLATAVLQQAPGQVVSSTGEVTSSAPGKKNLRADVLLQWRENRWTMLDVTFGGPEGSTP